jgi:hypothetical protein
MIFLSLLMGFGVDILNSSSLAELLLIQNWFHSCPNSVKLSMTRWLESNKMFLVLIDILSASFPADWTNHHHIQTDQDSFVGYRPTRKKSSVWRFAPFVCIVYVGNTSK